MAETKMERLEDRLEGLQRRARNMQRNWEANALRVINSAETVVVAGALGKAEAEDFAQGETFGLRLEHWTALGATLAAVATDDETLGAHAQAIATGAGAVIAYKKMAG